MILCAVFVCQYLYVLHPHCCLRRSGRCSHESSVTAIVGRVEAHMDDYNAHKRTHTKKNICQTCQLRKKCVCVFSAEFLPAQQISVRITHVSESSSGLSSSVSLSFSGFLSVSICAAPSLRELFLNTYSISVVSERYVFFVCGAGAARLL